MSQKQLESTAATQASRLWDVDLDVLPKDTSILPTNRHKLSCYILEDLLDCPVGSQFIVCIATDGANLEHGEYYSDKTKTIANEVEWSKGNCEHWGIYGQRYFVR
jgi:hypothetical protein